MFCGDKNDHPAHGWNSLRFGSQSCIGRLKEPMRVGGEPPLVKKAEEEWHVVGGNRIAIFKEDGEVVRIAEFFTMFGTHALPADENARRAVSDRKEVVAMSEALGRIRDELKPERTGNSLLDRIWLIAQAREEDGDHCPNCCPAEGCRQCSIDLCDNCQGSG